MGRTMADLSVLLATVDTLPQPYEVLGLVEASFAANRGVVPTASLWDRLRAEAYELGADGVIGIRLSQVVLPSASKQRWFGNVEHWSNVVVAVATGTAVRLLADSSA